MSGTGLPTSQRSEGWDDPWRRWDASAHETPRPLSKASVTSLVFGLIGGVLFGLIFGFVGLAATGRHGDRRGRGLAWAGIALSVVWIVVVAGVIGWRVSQQADRGLDGAVQQAGTSGVLDLQRGDCLQDPGTASDITKVDVVPCDQAHDAQVFAVVQPYTDPAYDATAIKTQVEQACRDAATSGVTAPESASLEYFFPQRDGWLAGRRNSVCILATSAPTTTSAVTG